LPQEQDPFKFKRDSLQLMSFDSNKQNFGPRRSAAMQIVSPAGKLLRRLESLDADGYDQKRKILQRAQQIEYFHK
jgi:hypothetical protein